MRQAADATSASIPDGTHLLSPISNLLSPISPLSQPLAAATTRDPAAVWDLANLKETPRVRVFPGCFQSGATPIFIEGVPWRGRETWCFAYYGVPEWATPSNPAPGIVLVHGGLGTAYPEWVRLWVKRGYAAICVDTCGALPIRTAEGADKWLANPDGGPRGWGESLAAADEPEQDQWVYHAVAAVMLSHSFLRSRPNVDSRAIGLTGVSWGGFLACILAAADDRLAYAVPVYGCGFNHEAGVLLDQSDPRLLETWTHLWEPSVFLSNAKCPMLWVDGTNDFAFSLDRVRRSAALAPVEHAFSTHLRMDHGHGAPGEGPREILAFADHYARGGGDIVRFTDCHLDGNRFAARFNANGRRIVRAELLYTLDGAATRWPDRFWHFTEADSLDAASSIVSATLPFGTFAWCLNLVTDDALVFSTPYMEQPR